MGMGNSREHSGDPRPACKRRRAKRGTLRRRARRKAAAAKKKALAKLQELISKVSRGEE